MKKKYLSFGLLFGAVAIISCNDGADDTSSTSDTTTTVTSTTDNSAAGTTSTAMPLNDSDREFVIKAAKGGMMEVDVSTVAMENAQSQRVKDLATMIQQDHANANSELKGFATSRGLTLPEDSLRKLNEKHLDAMRKMKGKAFDKHYIDMMKDDHVKDIAEFEKASATATDADLKAWAAKTLPVLQKHRDSVLAVSKAKM
jgi:putative membrane protein